MANTNTNTNTDTGTAANTTTTAAAPAQAQAQAQAMVRVQGLTMAFGDKLVQQGLNFEVQAGEVLVIMGSSGCGKSTLLRHMIGLLQPAAGQVLYGQDNFHTAPRAVQDHWRRSFGVTFQAGALWTAMSVGENIELPMAMFTQMTAKERQARAQDKLRLVGLADQYGAEPSALSGGMRKRAAIARALALEPPLLYLNEPTSGLDPVTSARLDELILQLQADLGTTVVMVTHELASIFAVADRALFLDAQAHTMAAIDAPQALLQHGPPQVQAFLRREAGAVTGGHQPPKAYAPGGAPAGAAA